MLLLKTHHPKWTAGGADHRGAFAAACQPAPSPTVAPTPLPLFPKRLTAVPQAAPSSRQHTAFARLHAGNSTTSQTRTLPGWLLGSLGWRAPRGTAWVTSSSPSAPGNRGSPRRASAARLKQEPVTSDAGFPGSRALACVCQRWPFGPCVSSRGSSRRRTEMTDGLQEPEESGPLCGCASR